jgi:hypothetical protein
MEGRARQDKLCTITWWLLNKAKSALRRALQYVIGCSPALSSLIRSASLFLVLGLEFIAA